MDIIDTLRKIKCIWYSLSLSQIRERTFPENNNHYSPLSLAFPMASVAAGYWEVARELKGGSVGRGRWLLWVYFTKHGSCETHWCSECPYKMLTKGAKLRRSHRAANLMCSSFCCYRVSPREHEMQIGNKHTHPDLYPK